MSGNEGENEQSCSELRDASRIRRNEVIEINQKEASILFISFTLMVFLTIMFDYEE